MSKKNIVTTERQYNDSGFKSIFKIKNMNKSQNMANGIKFYNPDLVFEDEENIVIVEHSSTGDRKVHIGELTQFIDFCKKNNELNKKFSFILILDGKGEYPPTKESEQKRLEYYLDSFNIENLNIHFIGIIENNLDIFDNDIETLKNMCEIVYKSKDIKFAEYIEIVCSNTKKNIEDNILEYVSEQIQSEENIEIMNESYNICTDVEVPNIIDLELEIKYNNNIFILELSSFTQDDKIIVSVKIFSEERIKNSENNLYDLKILIKRNLQKIFRDIYWQYDTQNNYICMKMYSQIHNIENEFRKSIIEFIVKKYGYKWQEEMLSNKKLEDKIQEYSKWYKLNYSEFNNIYSDIFNLDVKDLIELLKSTYESNYVKEETKDYFRNNSLSDKIISKGINAIISTIQKDLNSIMKKHNIWDKHIKHIFSDNFEQKWNEFSKMRNMVAHNKPICNDLYNDFTESIKELNYELIKLSSHIASNLDVKSNEQIEILDSKIRESYEYLDYLYREESGIKPLPDEDDVILEIIESNEINDLTGTIEEYIWTYNCKIEEISTSLYEYKERLLTENDHDKNRTLFDILGKISILEEHFIDCDFSKVDDVRFCLEQVSEKLYEIIENNLCEEFYIGKFIQINIELTKILYIEIIGDICIEEGASDILTMELILDGNILETGTIEKTYGKYSITDGIAMPEIDDSLDFDIYQITSKLEEQINSSIFVINKLEEDINNVINLDNDINI